MRSCILASARIDRSRSARYESDGVSGMRVHAGADWGETLDGMCVEAAAEEIRTSGSCLPPRLHLLVDGPELPYVGYLACRRFYQGDDAIKAVGMMGAMASLLGASRLALTWEHQDMSAALRVPDAPAGQVVLDADRSGRHVLRWHPVWIEQDPQHRDSASGMTPLWGPTDVVPDADLPPFAGACLAAWRQPAEKLTGPQLLARTGWFEANGYAMQWVQRPADEQGQPWWMDLLRPNM